LSHNSRSMKPRIRDAKKTSEDTRIADMSVRLAPIP
jgi:hypothetical protein